MSKVDHDMARAVDKVARRYARRCWWVDEDDLRQEAWLVAHKIRPKYDAQRAPSGTVRPLVSRAASRALTRLLLFQSAPVSASDGKRYDLVGLHRAPLPQEGATGEGDLRLKHVPAPLRVEETAERIAAREQWNNRVLSRLLEVCSPAELEGMMTVVVDGARPTAATSASMARLAGDGALKVLWEGEQPEVRRVNVLGDAGAVARALAAVPTAHTVEERRCRAGVDADVEVPESAEDDLLEALAGEGLDYELV